MWECFKPLMIPKLRLSHGGGNDKLFLPPQYRRRQRRSCCFTEQCDLGGSHLYVEVP